LVGFRIGIAALAFYLFQKYRGDLHLKEKSDYLKFAVMSIFGVSLNMSLFIWGLSLTKASNSSLLAVTIPIFTLIIGAILGQEKLRIWKVLGIVIAAIGVILLINPQKASFSSETTLGDLLIILNSLSYGIYVSISKETIARNGALKSITWVFIFASIICVPIGLFSLSAVDIISIDPKIWLMVLHIAIVSTALPYLLNAWALARVNPSTVAVYVYLQPVFGFIMAVVFLQEAIDLKVLISAALIFAGVYLVTKRRSQSAVSDFPPNQT
jgi:RarD protein